MRKWSDLFGKRSAAGQEHSIDLGDVWDAYCAQWPTNNERFEFWKPVSILPAPREVVAQAVKVAYEKWPEAVDWQVFSAFATEYADLAMHLPIDHYELVRNFQSIYRDKFGRDPLVMYRNLSASAAITPREELLNHIERIRDNFASRIGFEWKDVSDNVLEEVRTILLERAVNFATLVEEWRFFIFSIGRNTYTGQ